MNMRRRKRKAYPGEQPWEMWLQGSDRMYYIRHIKPCKTYSPWCSDCNAVLFRQEMKRFPHTVQEFNEYEDSKQQGELK